MNHTNFQNPFFLFLAELETIGSITFQQEIAELLRDS